MTKLTGDRDGLPLGARFLAGRGERETAISRFDDQDHWDVFTSSPVVAKQLIRRGWEPDSTWVGDGLRFILPKRAVSIRTRGAVENPRPRGPFFPKKRAQEPSS